MRTNEKPEILFSQPTQAGAIVAVGLVAATAYRIAATVEEWIHGQFADPPPAVHVQGRQWTVTVIPGPSAHRAVAIGLSTSHPIEAARAIRALREAIARFSA